MTDQADAVFPATEQDLGWARTEWVRTRRRMVELLEERLGGSPQEFVARLGATLHIEPLTLEAMRGCRPAFDVIAYADAARRTCLALRNGEDHLWIVLGDPFEDTTHDWIEERVREPFAFRIAHRLDVAAYLAQQEEFLRAMDGVVSQEPETATTQGFLPDLSIETISESESTVVRLVNSTIYDALKSGASDIHLETAPSGLAIKYRIDGVLTVIKTLPGSQFADQVISRVKVMSELDIAERRIPQDGRFRARSKGREIDFRVSVMPSVFGEDAVLRILDKQSLSDHLRGLTLDSLGFTHKTVEALRLLSAEPYGMMLVTGPTGSGKTTTLYAAISEINRGLDKIITIEDPVEYQLPGVLQIPVNEKKGLSFAVGLRSILRHDPDRIMVGEIRDPETAEIAVQSALTGHLVYTTVHANNVFDVIGRFLHMGVDTYNFVAALNAVLAQRLVRVICPHCAEDELPQESLLVRSRIDRDSGSAYRFRHGRGCGLCRGTGYRGRKAIAELLMMNDDLRELIVARAPVRKLREAARAAGTSSLREAALSLVAAGETTLEEINRVTLVA